MTDLRRRLNEYEGNIRELLVRIWERGILLPILISESQLYYTLLYSFQEGLLTTDQLENINKGLHRMNKIETKDDYDDITSEIIMNVTGHDFGYFFDYLYPKYFKDNDGVDRNYILRRIAKWRYRAITFKVRDKKVSYVQKVCCSEREIVHDKGRFVCKACSKEEPSFTIIGFRHPTGTRIEAQEGATRIQNKQVDRLKKTQMYADVGNKPRILQEEEGEILKFSEAIGASKRESEEAIRLWRELKNFLSRKSGGNVRNPKSKKYKYYTHILFLVTQKKHSTLLSYAQQQNPDKDISREKTENTLTQFIEKFHPTYAKLWKELYQPTSEVTLPTRVKEALLGENLTAWERNDIEKTILQGLGEHQRGGKVSQTRQQEVIYKVTKQKLRWTRAKVKSLLSG